MLHITYTFQKISFFTLYIDKVQDPRSHQSGSNSLPTLGNHNTNETSFPGHEFSLKSEHGSLIPSLSEYVFPRPLTLIWARNASWTSLLEFLSSPATSYMGQARVTKVHHWMEHLCSPTTSYMGHTRVTVVQNIFHILFRSPLIVV